MPSRKPKIVVPLHPELIDFQVDVSDKPPVWRPVHYLGSKLRIADDICNLIDELEPSGGMVCDMFAGSATVSMALARTRDVLASDIQEYSRVLCSAVLLGPETDESVIDKFLICADNYFHALSELLSPLIEVEKYALENVGTTPSCLCDISEAGPLLEASSNSPLVQNAILQSRERLKSKHWITTTTNYFGGVYFSYAQAAYIDALLMAIKQLPFQLRDLLLAAVLSTASTLVSSIGKQFAQPIRLRRKDGSIKTHLIQQASRDRSTDAREAFKIWIYKYISLKRRGSHLITRNDYEHTLETLPSDVRIIYADPPYTRDHYSRFYHVLETLCLQDAPELSPTCLTSSHNIISRGIYRSQRHQSPFCIKSRAPAAFTVLFEKASRIGIPILLSYSPFVKSGHPRLLTIEAIKQIASVYYTYVKVMEINSLTHSKLNKTDRHLETASNAEVFVACQV